MSLSAHVDSSQGPLPVIGALRPWADPQIVAVNRLAMHVPLPAGPGMRVALDGDWSFALFETPDDVTAEAVGGALAPGGRTQPVPGNWTLPHHPEDPGTGDLPHYTNIEMPFPGPPPALPSRNPAGVYRRRFDVPVEWAGHRVVVHVGGAESVHAVYVNGGFAGYGTDSRLPSEYDVTDLVGVGENELAIVVVRYSAHSYVEDQDQWWMAGLHRKVFVEARAAVHIADVTATAALRPDGTGVLDVATTVSFDVPAAGWTVRTRLESSTGAAVGEAQQHPVPHVFAQPYVFTGHVATSHFEVPAVDAWSAEQPNRYRLGIELIEPGGAVVGTGEQWVGFRTVEVRDGRLLVNGEPIWVFGVNRHDHHPDRGKAVTAEDIRADLVAMRAHNISAVRTSHYPNDSAFYDLCDELGMYVVDEANIECHAYNTSLCDDDRFLAAWLARGSRMVQRDRNHPCVIAWSLGNESGYGANHTALAGWIRRTDPTRPLHYEGAVAHDGWEGGRDATDIVCPMYPEIAAIAEHRGDRPLIMCEYSHAMGNSNGSLADYWATIETTPGLQGGFLWEWKDHGLRQRLADGTTRLAYGGQFGERHHDGNFVADGLVSADLEPHPALTEVAWVYRPITVAGGGDGDGLTVHNRQSFTDASAFDASWELLLDGVAVAGGPWTLPPIRPHGRITVPLPCDVPDEPGEVHLTVRFVTPRATWFAPAGHVVARDQVTLRAGAPRRAVAPAAHVRPELQLWRAPIDNDGFKLMPWMAQWGVGGKALDAWHAAGLDTRPADELVEHHAQRGADGSFEHHVQLPDAFPDPARVGVQFTLAARFSRLRWFGRGPGENYPDRNAGSVLGIWESAPDACPYLVPQEFGLRTDCRWFECIDLESGDVVRIEAVDPVVLHCSATHHTNADLADAPTNTELVRRDELIVRVDASHRGLGTASCGPDVLARYELQARTYRFSYRILEIPGGMRARSTG